MSKLHSTLLACVCAFGAPLGVLAPIASARQQNPAAADRLSDADLEELLAPIALYPDPLLANVLAASCYPSELAQASKAAGNSALIDAADWEPSVRAVAKIPDALSMMTQYPDWTTALGEAFILQSPDVMKAVQRLRARAQASGALRTTPQQVVQTQGDTIVIQPAQTEVIYVPSYQPSVVYVDSSHNDAAAGLIGFGLGITAGLIIANNIDCDWHGGGCCFGCGGWGHHGDVDIDINRNTNINNINNINNIKNNGNKWKANNNKLSQDLRAGQGRALQSYKGVGSGRAQGAPVPNRQPGAAPIANRPAPRPSQASRAGDRPGPNSMSQKPQVQRPQAQPMQRPANMQRPSTPKAMPSIPPSSNRPAASRTQQNRPSSPGASNAPTARSSTPSAYRGGGNSKAASRGAVSRGSRSAGGGGGRGGRR